MLLKQIKTIYDWQTVIFTIAIMFTISSCLLIPLTFRFKAKTTDKALNEIKESLQFVKQSAILKQLLLLASIAYLLMGPMQVILPSIAQDNLSLGDTAQGYYLSLVAFSLIIGGLIAIKLKDKENVGWKLMISILLAGLGIGSLALITNITLSASILILSATFGGIAISFIVAGLQQHSSHEHRGRIMSFYTIIGQAVPAASGVGAGLLAQAYNPSVAIMVISTIIVICILIAIFTLKQIRQLNQL